MAERARMAGARLSGLGFEVLRIGRAGISIAGEPKCFAKVFGVYPKPGEAVTLNVHPRDAELEDLIDYLEIAPKPTLYEPPGRVGAGSDD
jgi:hypothetical protein